MTNLLLNPYLGSLSTPFWAPRRQVLCSHFAHMWPPTNLLPLASAPTLAPIPALAAPLLQIWMLGLLPIPIPKI